MGGGTAAGRSGAFLRLEESICSRRTKAGIFQPPRCVCACYLSREVHVHVCCWASAPFWGLLSTCCYIRVPLLCDAMVDEIEMHKWRMEITSWA